MSEGPNEAGRTRTSPGNAGSEVDRPAMVRALQTRLFVVGAFASGPLALVHRDIATAWRAAVAMGLIAVGGSWMLRRRPEWTVAVGVGVQLAFCALIVASAQALGGSNDTALVIAFIPGFFAILTLGWRIGWGVVFGMVLGMAYLYRVSPPSDRLSELRFACEIVMILFAAAFAHTLANSFEASERLVARRRDALQSLGQARASMAQAIYGELEPQAKALVALFEDAASGRPIEKGSTSRLAQAVLQLSGTLRQAKVLTTAEPLEFADLNNHEPLIRRDAMRLWLRVGAGLVVASAVWNAASDTPIVHNLILLVCCLGFDLWLGMPEALRRLEATALTIGLVASGSLLALIYASGGGVQAPLLVVTPATVLFTAVLSSGPAALLMVALNLGILALAARGGSLDPVGERLLGDLGIVFVSIVVAIRFVMTVRRGFGRALATQAESIARALRQHRRLAGTLFHDANNHLQALLLYAEMRSPGDSAAARSMAIRVQRLIGLSKAFLAEGDSSVHLEPVSVTQAFALVREAYLPLMQAKEITLDLQPGDEEQVLAEPALLIESVLGNLVSNAVKFSPPGAEVRLSTERQGRELHILVSDSGPGFPREILDGIEDREGKARSERGSAGEAGQGYGIGLAREHALRMGGRLELANREGGGAQCRLSFAVAASE